MSDYLEKPNPYGAEPQHVKQGGSWVPACLIGCLLSLLIAIGLVAWGGYLVYKNFRQIAADAVRNAMVQAIEESELSDEDKQAITAQIDRVVDEFKSGAIGFEELGRVFEELGESPLLAHVLVFSTVEKYVDPSGLSDEEKAEAEQTLQRLARGVYEKTIDPESLEPLLDHISTKGPDGERQFRDKISDEELRTFLQDCKTRADEAGIPDEPFEIDIGAEVKKAVDRALGGVK